MKNNIKKKISTLKSLSKNGLSTSSTTSCSEVSKSQIFKYIKTERDAAIFRKELSLALQKTTI